MQGDGAPRLQSRAQAVAIPAPLLLFFLGTEQRTALPRGHWALARPDVMGSTREGGGTPPNPSSWWLKRRPPLPADAPSGKGHPDPGLTTEWAETSPAGGQGHRATQALCTRVLTQGTTGPLPTARPHAFLLHLREIITLPTPKKHSQQILVS